ncbi:MAG: DNA-binding protein [Clostridia bacterium]|nr:DNA-binding protein [Clostridia bacterium]
MPKDLYVSALLDVYGNFLNEKQRALAEFYYNQDLSLGEIAENEGITRQGVNDAVKRATARLYDLENQCGYCKKFLRLKELNTSLKAADTDTIKEISDIIENL